jgi:alkylation response protein AidB-like acyl-CoA dehydrogenase
MDFTDSPNEATFRQEVCGWLAANAAPRAHGGPPARLVADDTEGMRRARAWQRAKADQGFACITWPEKWGGRNGSAIEDVIFRSEELMFDVPDNPFSIGLGMCIPTLIHHADAATVDRYVLPAVRGDEIWCQLFSEPSGGSDLASLRTRAQRDGDHWLVNGQKIWTSRAHLADFGLLLARTDPDVPKHKGLTMFWVDMRAPGVEVRPIKQMSDESEFNEVFMTDLRLDDAQRIGAVGDGWKVAMSTLSHERVAVGLGEESGGVEDLVRLAGSVDLDRRRALDDPSVRTRIAEFFAREQGLRFTLYRALTALSKGASPGPEGSIGKLVSATQRQQIASFALDLLDMGGLGSDGKDGSQFSYLYLWSPAARIAGGTDEILRNIIAERVLGLPAEPRVDKNLPFSAAR